MLMPKRMKYRKQQRGNMKGKASRGNVVSFGEYGLQALEPVWPALPVGDSAAPGNPHAGTGATWQPWTPEALTTARASQRPVFVDFTAAWCVTCQLNKRLVLERSEVLAAFASADAVLLCADWTRQDPAITAELARLGRGGVPVYALYPPSGEVTLLPEILSPAVVIDALRPYRRPAGDT